MPLSFYSTQSFFTPTHTVVRFFISLSTDQAKKMAQKREKEETELKVPENLPLCTPPPISTPLLATEEDKQITTFTSSTRSTESSDPKLSGPDYSRPISARSPERTDLASVAEKEGRETENRVGLKRSREVSRCSGTGCRKKIGLIGFRCRCGEVFCSEHRYSDRHDCSYDYKSAGREAIARENPVVRAAKILKV